MNCLAIDDEPLALNIIKDFCSKLEFLHLVGIYTNAMDALQVLENQDIDLIFLDIHMPNINGLEFAKTMCNPPMIIFTTAFSEHALEAYDLNAIDYMVKPIPFERFLKSVNKAQSLYRLQNSNQKASLNEFMMVKADYATIKVSFKDILYVEGLKDYVKIFIKDQMILTKTTMKNIDKKLPHQHFIRIHKSYIVNLLNIEKIESNHIIYGRGRLPIGNSYRLAFFDMIDQFKL